MPNMNPDGGRTAVAPPRSPGFGGGTGFGGGGGFGGSFGPKPGTQNNNPAPQPPKPPPPPPTPAYRPPATTSTSSTGRVGMAAPSGGGGGAPMASFSTPIAPPPPPPPPPSIEEWLGTDEGFKGSEAAMRKAMEDFGARYNLDNANYDTEFNAKTQQLDKDREFSLERMMEDYASRGLVRSGLYNEADTELDGKFNDMRGDFDRARGQFKSNLDADKAQFETDNTLGLQRARQEALARRSAQFGLV